MRLTKLVCAAALAVHSGLALASYSYSYFEVGYLPDVDTDVDQGDGLDLRVRFDMGEFFFFNGYVEGSEGDDLGAQFDRFGLGVGAHVAWLEEKLGLYAAVGYEDLELSDFPPSVIAGSFNDNGYGGALGARYALMEGKLELSAEYDYDSYDRSEGNFWEIGASYAFFESYAGVLSYSSGDIDFEDTDGELEHSAWRVGLRVQF